MDSTFKDIKKIEEIKLEPNFDERIKSEFPETDYEKTSDGLMVQENHVKEEINDELVIKEELEEDLLCENAISNSSENSNVQNEEKEDEYILPDDMTESATSTSVNELLQTPFSLRSFEDKKIIIENGKPRPPLPGLSTPYKDRKHGKEYTRHFSERLYSSTSWLTGCNIRNKVFCWYCLLFCEEKSIWNMDGYCDLNHLTAAVHKHEKCQGHIQSHYNLKMFGLQRIYPKKDQRSNVAKHNEKVRTNREILKRLIDAICLLAKQELPFWHHNEQNSLNKGNSLEILKLLRSYDPVLDSHLKNATVLRSYSLTLQHDLTKAISDFLIQYIKNEMSNCSDIAIILDETSDIPSESQLSTVFRYVVKGEVVERFVGFTNTTSSKTANAIFDHVKLVVSDFKVAEKLIAQTYDGASVISDDLNGLKKKVLEEYPLAIFTPCYSHVLNLVLKQGLSNIKQCRIFFQTLHGLSSFFLNADRRKNALQAFMKKKLHSIAPIRWNFISRLENTVKEYRCGLLEFFENIEENSNNWDEDTICKAQGFISFLSKFETTFLLEISAKIFGYTDFLHNILQTEQTDILFCSNHIKEVLKKIQEDRINGFATIWEHISPDFDAERTPKRFKLDENIFRQLYLEIIDNIRMQISSRFESFDQIGFFQLLSSKSYNTYKNKFPDNLINILKSSYKYKFDYVSLKNELSVIYTSSDFANKPIRILSKFICDNDLTLVFPETYKLINLILTIPRTSSSAERTFPALKRINSYCRSTKGQKRLDHLSIISIEKDLIFKLKENPEFYDKVIELYASQNRKVELMYE